MMRPLLREAQSQRLERLVWNAVYVFQRLASTAKQHDFAGHWNTTEV